MVKELKIGDKVRITDFYRSNYPIWSCDEGIITYIFPIKKIPAVALGKEEAPIYRNHYGIATEYPIVSFLMKANETEFLVNQLGFDK